MRFALLSLAACGGAAPVASAYPLLDGRCDDYAALAHEQHAVARGVDLAVFQDRDYVWLCITLPPGDFGALDLALSAPALAAPLDLHASAQLGEWPADATPPNDPGAPVWGNQRGWAAATVPFHGMAADGHVRFAPTPARELQLAKARFGRGTWRFHATVHDVTTAGGDVRFPSTGEHVLAVW